jgi:hypothetical protein
MILFTSWEFRKYEAFAIGRRGHIWCGLPGTTVAALLDGMLSRIPVKVTATAKLSEEHILLDILTDSGTPSHIEELSIWQAIREGKENKGCDLGGNGLKL